MKLNWKYDGEPGYWHSAEMRFQIEPYGYRNTVQPDLYTLTDQLGELVGFGAPLYASKGYQCDSVTDCKKKAFAIVQHERAVEHLPEK